MRQKTAVLTIALIFTFGVVGFGGSPVGSRSFLPAIFRYPTPAPTMTFTPGPTSPLPTSPLPTPTFTPTPGPAFLPIILNQQLTFTPTPDFHATEIAELRATLSAIQTALASTPTP
jgi:hypothetical protein